MESLHKNYISGEEENIEMNRNVVYHEVTTERIH